MNRWAELIISLAIVALAAFVGSMATAPEIPTWYVSLIKPALNPPAWIFGPVWTVLYVCMAVAAWRVWQRRGQNDVRSALKVYAAQLLTNVLWSLIFFGRHAIYASVAIILALALLILVTVYRFYQIDRAAGYLFVPYILWVAFATYLNIGLAVFNH